MMRNQIETNRDQLSPDLEWNSRRASSTLRERQTDERLEYHRGARSHSQAMRGKLRRALLALLIGSVALGGILAPIAPAPAGTAPSAQASAIYADAAAAGAAVEQPQSWLLKWSTPAQAHELRGVEVIRRQEVAAVDVVRPALDSGEDVEAWLRRISGESGVEYVHPNQQLSILSLTGEQDMDLNAIDESSSTSFNKPSSEQPAASEARLSESSSDLPAASEARPSEDPAITPPSAAKTSPPSKAPKEGEQAKAEAITANDPELSKQSHLTQIGAIKAWETVREHKDLIIALVDTGVDLDHPDLKGNLVQGTNLIKSKKPPEDDNGHGTSVAGVIAAVGNNSIGGSGILWNAKLMPIKALDEWGDGSELDLGEAILYAIRNGAKIVVMSVGLHRYSPYMQDIVNYAENKDVLLVAASGNDGVTSGKKAAVKYPAAYPTVLAVGGATSKNTPDPRSNPGTELDILAPWTVYTTALGGTYKKEEGTSMAAPQVAAAAALIMAKYPSFKPYQVRELLRQTAKDIGNKGVDSTSGYGVLQLDKAVTESLSKDSFEPNDSIGAAKKFPLYSQITAALEKAKDTDWFVVDVPADGKLSLNYKSYAGDDGVLPVVRVSHYAQGKLQRNEDIKLSNKVLSFEVLKGKQLIGVQFSNPDGKQALTYSLTNSFIIRPDAYEPNDKLEKAINLEPKTQSLTGSFHQSDDRDWFVVNFKQHGKLDLSLDTNSVRIDPGLSVQREGQPLVLYDENGEGISEKSPVISVTPGKYYIRVHNAIALEASPTPGIYTLKLKFTPQLNDPNEPNNKSYEALLMSPGTEYRGVMSSASDTDWFQFRVSTPSVVTLAMTGIPSNVQLRLEGLDKRMIRITSGSSGTKGKIQTTEQTLQPGVYYVKLTTNKAFNNQYYRLRLIMEELVSGFKDIKGHWAQNDITSLTTQNIVNGAGGYRFEPERSITRAEAVAMIVKAYKPITNVAFIMQFNDVSSTHWAYESIQKAVQHGWVKGFPDESFRPDQPITRAEMAVMIGYADGIKGRFPNARPFVDVAPYEWYSTMLFAMKLEGKLQGVEPGRYAPDRKASRAEFTMLLYRYYQD